MPEYAEANNLGDVLKSEAPNLYSREAVTVLAGAGAARALKVGEVIGKRTKSTVAVTADAGNTGDGAATLADPALGAKAEAGAYSLICVAAAVDGGTFEVLTPKGYKLPDLTVGQPYAGDHINLTIADGAADFVVGDTFTVDVSGDGKVVALDPAGVDGTAEAFGISAADVTAPDGADAEGTAIVRDAILADHAIVWPAGITQSQKDAALAALEARGILVRQGA
jgi:hypothetical protein